jgi:D-glycero-D-manno-heptose 1,7-bisphosphate phosphatase
MSPMGVENFTDGVPAQPRTWTKLRSWYLREVVGTEGEGPESGAVALGGFLHFILPPLRHPVTPPLRDPVDQLPDEPPLECADPLPLLRRAGVEKVSPEAELVVGRETDELLVVHRTEALVAAEEGEARGGRRLREERVVQLPEVRLPRENRHQVRVRVPVLHPFRVQDERQRPAIRLLPEVDLRVRQAERGGLVAEVRLRLQRPQAALHLPERNGEVPGAHGALQPLEHAPESVHLLLPGCHRAPDLVHPRVEEPRLPLDLHLLRVREDTVAGVRQVAPALPLQVVHHHVRGGDDRGDLPHALDAGARSEGLPRDRLHLSPAHRIDHLRCLASFPHRNALGACKIGARTPILCLSIGVGTGEAETMADWEGRVVLLDKDGTLVEDVPYNVDPARIRLAPGAAEGARLLHEAGFRLVVVSNQSGVARGHFPEAALAGVEARLRELLARAGAPLDGFLYCPHHPEGAVPEYTRACDCRKPAPGLLLRALKARGADPARSWMVGDILNDVEAGRRAGCRTVLVDAGSETEWALSPERLPHHVVRDLAEAARVIVALSPTAGGQEA